MGNNFFGNLFNLKKTARGKSSPSSLPLLCPAPEFRGLKNWINTPPIASMRQLLGKVVLIDFLDLLLHQLPERNALCKNLA